MYDFVKRMICSPDPSYFERALGISIIENKFTAIRETPNLGHWTELWKAALQQYGNGPVSYLEFGVFEGYSMRFFSSENTNPESRFYGFDSFEGLPEHWKDGMDKGQFDKGGQLPDIRDPRVSFIKGWFQNTLPAFLSERGSSLSENLIVQFDADLYSSTLFGLTQLDSLKKPYIALFDEFINHETRALYNYTQMSGAEVEFLAWTGDNRLWPSRAMCRIKPQEVYRVDGR